MAADFTALALATQYATLLAQISDRDAALALGMDPATTTVTNPLANAIRYNSANKRWEKHTGGGTYVELIAAATDAYAISVTGLRGGTLYGANALAASAAITGGAGSSIDVPTLKQAGSAVWTAATLTNLNQLTNGPAFITATALSPYAPLASPTFTGVPLAPTAAVDTSTTQLATTQYVVNQGYLKSATAVSTYLPLTGGTLSGALTATSFSGPHNGTVGATTPSTGAFTTLAGTTATFTSGASADTNPAFIAIGSSTSQGSVALGAVGYRIAGGSAYGGVDTVVAGATITHASSTGLSVTGAVTVSPTDSASGGYNFTGFTDYRIWAGAGSMNFRIGGSGTMFQVTGAGVAVTGALSATGAATAAGFVVSNGASIVANNSDNSNYYYLQNSGATGAGNPVLDFVQGGVGTRIRLDSSGNLGLGVTPSAWGTSGSAYKVSQFGVSAFVVGRTGNEVVIVGSNAYNDGTNWRYSLSGNFASFYQQASGSHSWYTAPSGTAGNAVSFTQVMTLSSASLGMAVDIQLNAQAIRWDQSGVRSWSMYASSGNMTLSSGDSLGAINYIARSHGFVGRASTSPTSYAHTAALSVDAAMSNFIVVGAMTSNVTSVTISNAQEGQFLTIRFTQDGTGGRTITTGNMGATNAPSIQGAPSTTANKSSYLNLTYNATAARWEGSWLATT